MSFASSRSADAARALRALHAEMRACRRCQEAGFSIVPGAVFSGPVTARVMVVGQAPGETEVEAGRPFNGPAGRRLFGWLADAGWEEDVFRAGQYVTAITKCYPGKASGGRGDRAPGRAERQLCAPFLAREIGLVQPEIIIPVGSLAVRRFLGRVRLKEVVGTATRDDDGRWIVPFPHPSGASLWLNNLAHRELVQVAVARLRALVSSQSG